MAESSGCEVVTETQVVVVYDLVVTETVVVESSGCQLGMVMMAVHGDGWQQH